MFVHSGFALIITAAAPAAKGAEKEVPDAFLYIFSVFDLTQYVLTPLAQTSGLILPSNVGPLLLKLAMTSFASTAPTDKTESASAGVII